MHIMTAAERHAATIYTDGSVDHTTGAAGAAFVCNTVTRRWRVSDGASSLQTELVAIRGALEYVLTSRPVSVLIATDSKASLQALRKRQPLDNVGLITAIHHLAQNIRAQGTTISLHWVPGHADIRGNELADSAARAAAAHPTTDVHVPPSLSLIKKEIKRGISKISKRAHAAEVEGGSPSATWYARATRLEPLSLPSTKPSHLRARIHRLRLGYKCLRELANDRPHILCDNCDTATIGPLLHYLLECPASTSIRDDTRQYPNSADDSALSAAADLVAETTLPKLLELVAETPPPR